MYYYTLPRNINYYTVSKIGTGTEEDSYRPDIPDGFSFVGVDCQDGDYFVFTNTELPGKIPISHKDLKSVCEAKGIKHSDILKWKV